MDADDLFRALCFGLDEGVVEKPVELLPSISTGLSLLNYGLTGDFNKGIEAGSVLSISGSSNSGRTTLGLTILAETTLNHFFDEYDYLYCDVSGSKVDLRVYFGRSLANRLTVMHFDDLSAFWLFITNTTKPYVLFMDSLDALSVESNGREMNNDKACYGFSCVKKNKSILVLTGQEIIRNGHADLLSGNSIRSYSDLSLRTTKVSDIEEVVRRRSRVVGTYSSISILKSPYFCDKLRSIPAPIYSGSGYDNAYSLFLFLRRMRKIRLLETGYVFESFGWIGDKKSIIKKILDNEKEIESYIKTIV